MFAFLAACSFVLALFHVDHIWIFDTVTLGLLLVALHLWIGGGITLPWTRRPQ